MLDHVVITTVGSPRSLPAEELGPVAVREFGEDRVTVVPKLPDAIDAAVAIAERDDDMGAGVLIVGSVMLVAEARILLDADRRKGAGRAR